MDLAGEKIINSLRALAFSSKDAQTLDVVDYKKEFAEFMPAAVVEDNNDSTLGQLASLIDKYYESSVTTNMEISSSPVVNRAADQNDVKNILDNFKAFSRLERKVGSNDQNILEAFKQNTKVEVLYMGDSKRPDAVLVAIQPNPDNDKFLNLYHVEVGTQAGGNGYGRELVRKFVQEFGTDYSLGTNLVYLGEESGAQAAWEGFFKGLGFKPLGENSYYFRKAGRLSSDRRDDDGFKSQLREVLNTADTTYKEIKEGLDDLRNVSLPTTLEEKLHRKVYPMHGNVLVDTQTDKGVLILGAPESGKSLLSHEILNLSRHALVVDDIPVGFFFDEKTFIAGPNYVKGARTLPYRDRTGKLINDADVNRMPEFVRVKKVVLLEVSPAYTSQTVEKINSPEAIIEIIRRNSPWGGHVSEEFLKQLVMSIDEAYLVKFPENEEKKDYAAAAIFLPPRRFQSKLSS